MCYLPQLKIGKKRKEKNPFKRHLPVMSTITFERIFFLDTVFTMVFAFVDGVANVLPHQDWLMAVP